MGELTLDFDASEWFLAWAASWAESVLEASTESGREPTSDLLLSHCLLASSDLNMSINESGSPATEDELSLNASTKHSLATSIPSASTPWPGSTIPQEENQNGYYYSFQ